MKLVELLGPGGSFDSALYAMELGADAVYIGLKAFSARTAAVNFTFEELRRLRSYSLAKHKKIYVALNTIIKEEEWPRIHQNLVELSLIGVEGLILQDLGLISYIRRNFPFFRLHGSTQMAAHNHSSIEFLQKQGLSRVVLPREMTLSEIKALVSAHPEMEFEVFIHGALCFGFSGMCLASGILLGRSGNRGSCGQICRTWFQGPKGKGYYLSTKDLALEEDVRKLVDVGIHALKIEGRMKSPEYAGLASSYYRKCLENDSSPEKDQVAERLQLLFSRKRTKGFIEGVNNRKIYRSYASHLGLELGRVLESKKDRFRIKLKSTLAIRDGLMYLMPGEIQKPLKWALSGLFKGKQRITEAAKESEVWICAPLMIPPGAQIYKISAHDSNWKSQRQLEYPMAKTGFTLQIEVYQERLDLKATFPGLEKWIPSFQISLGISCQEARKNCDLLPILQRVFRQSDQVLFLPEKILWKNQCPWQDDKIYIPMKELKHLRIAFYNALDGFIKKHNHLSHEKMTSFTTPGPKTPQFNLPHFLNTIKRGELSPRANLPFVSRTSDLNLDTLAMQENWIFIPLSPLSLCGDLTPQSIEVFAKKHEDSNILIGLNHYYQIEAFKPLFLLKNCFFFCDYLFYTANTWTARMLMNSIPKLLWIYYWIEDTQSQSMEFIRSYPQYPFKLIEASFSPTLFISRFCFSLNSLDEDCCSFENPCQDKIHNLGQQNRSFKIVEQKGLCYIIEKKQGLNNLF
ncbi:MAG: U32 family peptidase [Spirochaetales bacterium]|nr:U32 family peptidase [Spirochaetales bacterium]